MEREQNIRCKQKQHRHLNTFHFRHGTRSFGRIQCHQSWHKSIWLVLSFEVLAVELCGQECSQKRLEIFKFDCITNLA